VFRITAYCADHLGKVKAANLGSWPCGGSATSVERLLDDDNFFKALEDRLSSKGLAVSQCESVYVRRGNTKPTRISVKVFP
jgi:hypothetical protein